ncbi:LOG family protein [Rubrimonas sp.]|uniref:LOG family protein n=1 Tax=Rubrimonas sp. TaxID=2036015 RepID=UPI002FDDC8B2
MTPKDERRSVFPPADRDALEAERAPLTQQTLSPAYRLAFDDLDFLREDALRPVRLQLELLKTELSLNRLGVDSTVALFGGARVPPPEKLGPDTPPGLAALAPWYDVARDFAAAASRASLARGGREFVVVTGGGPGVMEAGNRGAVEVGAKTIGLGIVLPHEQAPNGWVTPELCFNFHYFAIRKMHFLMRAAAIAVFPGGFGTMDELFETLTLIQTGRMARIPILLFGEAFWRRVVNFDALTEAGVISPGDLELFSFVETAQEGWARVAAHHRLAEAEER